MRRHGGNGPAEQAHSPEITKEEIVALYTVGKGLEIGAGQTLIHEGEPGGSAYFVLDGSLQIIKNINRKEVEIGKVEPGDFVGEIGFTKGAMRLASVIALEPTVLLQIDEESLNRLRPEEKLSFYKKLRESSDQRFNKLLNGIFLSLKSEAPQLAPLISSLEEVVKLRLNSFKSIDEAMERINSELNIARDTQMNMLPRNFPAFPERPEFDIYAFMEPAKEVGGDLYDFFLVDEKYLCFVIGDVSGKGIPASLFMAVTKTLTKAIAMDGVPPHEILTKTNNELSRDNDSCMFVTMFVGLLDTETGEVLYANGGHNPPLVIRKDKGISYLRKRGGLVIGAFEGMEYTLERLTLEPGDSFFIYTDGVTEAMNKENDFFLEERLLLSLSSLREKPLEEMISGIMDKVRCFADGASQSDDITMMALQYIGNGK